ncbi:uncharacterized protein [Henckelia pumila]|uniref:uncharacterized protein n=1 Tax=Henckelia pumila TaxID=405737 RepID=UPI003C6DE03D
MSAGESSEEKFPYDSEIDITFHRRRREARLRLEGDEHQTENLEEDMAANANLSLRQLGNPNLNQKPLCITFPTLEANATFELKSGLIHLLPSFHGLVGEDTHKLLMEFHVVCTSMKPHGVTEEQIQLRAFPFSLKNAAKDWLYYLPPGSITTWTEMKRIFLEKYFPSLRKQISGKKIYDIKKHMWESLHEYWKRFKKLRASYLQHQISENLLIQYCYEGLLPHERIMADAASGGVFVNKTPREARNLIENMTANSQQFGTNRSDHAPKKNNEVNVYSLEQQLIELKSLVRWKDHPNLRYENPSANQPGPHAQPHNQAYRPPYPTQQQRPQILAQENASAITLRNEKELKVKEKVVDASSKKEQNEELNMDDKEATQGDVQKGTSLCEVFEGMVHCKKEADVEGMPKDRVRIKCICCDRKKTTCKMQRSRSNTYPRGVVEDVLVQVNNLVFSADFYVLDMKNGDNNSSILLGRPLLKTSMTKIDVHSGTLTMEFDGEVLKFNIYDSMKFPNGDDCVYSVDIVDYLAQECFVLLGKYELEVAIRAPIQKDSKEAPVIELKTLPQHLKYVFLG